MSGVLRRGASVAFCGSGVSRDVVVTEGAHRDLRRSHRKRGALLGAEAVRTAATAMPSVGAA